MLRNKRKGGANALLYSRPKTHSHMLHIFKIVLSMTQSKSLFSAVILSVMLQPRAIVWCVIFTHMRHNCILIQLHVVSLTDRQPR